MKFIQAKHYQPSNRTAIDLVVIHTAECGETAKADENVGTYFAGPNAPIASAHYMVDVDSITQYVLEKDIAWHAGPVNGFSIGIEHAGFAKQNPAEWADAYSSAMLEASAKLTADLCKRYSIPVVKLSAEDLKAGKRRGICGHVDVTNGLTKGKGHWDPGPSFPWDSYLARVRELMNEPFAPAPSAPSLVDVVRDTIQVVTDHARATSPVVAPVLVTDVDLSSFVEVEHAGATWLVCPIYVAPVGIGEARDMAARLGCELPTPGLVDEIWRAADCKINANDMVFHAKDGNDFTPRTMNSFETHTKQAEKLARLVGERSLGVDFKLLAGAFKDVVVSGGKLGLYGWHTASGTPIQPFYSGHAPAWKDYSQGLRLVRRKA